MTENITKVLLKLGESEPISDQYDTLSKLLEYDHLASAAYEMYQENFEKWVHAKSGTPECSELNSRWKACAISFYNFGRVCLALASSLNREIDTEEMKNLQRAHESWVKQFTKIRNKLGNHVISGANTIVRILKAGTTSGGGGPGMTVQIYAIETKKVVDELMVNPASDKKKLDAYLDELSKLYEKYF